MDMTHAIDCSREALRMALVLGGLLAAAASGWPARQRRPDPDRNCTSPLSDWSPAWWPWHWCCSSSCRG